MKEKKGHKANDSAAIERRKQKKAAQHQSGDRENDQIFAEAANKDTFGPPKISYIKGRQARGNNRLTWE